MTWKGAQRGMPRKDKEQKKAYAAVYRAANREQERARHAAYHAANRELIRERKRRRLVAYYAVNMEQIRARYAAYRKTHPDAIRIKNARRRARKRVAPLNDLTAVQWRAIKEHSKHRCVYCHRKLKRLTMDHILPLSKGGAHTLSNIVPACRSCNSKKHTGAPLKPVQPLLLCTV